MCFAPQPRAFFWHQTSKKWSAPVSFSTFSPRNVVRTTAACHFWTSELPKWLRHRQFLSIFTSKCAFRHSVPFSNIGTSKMAPKPSVFEHLHFQMCFSPQPRAIFEHRNFQNGSDTVSFWAFSLPNVLFATAACHFRTSELPKWLRHRQFLSIFTSKCAFRHSRAPFSNIGTFKMAPTPSVFEHLHFQMCFSPQPRAIFEHRNFQNGSENEVFWTFWLANVLRATAACHFSPVCWTATSAPASLARLLFEHQEPRIIEKTQRFATSLTFFAHVPSF